MVYSLMCARDILEENDDILVSYGDIIYNIPVLQEVLGNTEEASGPARTGIRIILRLK